MPPRPKNYYLIEAHRLLRQLIAARDRYVEQMNRDDATHPVRDADYERQFAAVRTLIAAALAYQSDETR